MNKLISILAAACMFGAVACTGALAGQPYVGVSAGLAMPTDSDWGSYDDVVGYDTGYDLGAAAGYKFNENVRLELAFDYSKADVDELGPYNITDGDVDTKSLMVNGYYTIPVSDTVGIYGMAGVGVAEVEVEDSTRSEDDTVMAGNLGVGVTYAVADNVAMDLGYTYFVTEDADIIGEDFSYADNRVKLGIRYMF